MRVYHLRWWRNRFAEEKFQLTHIELQIKQKNLLSGGNRIIKRATNAFYSQIDINKKWTDLVGRKLVFLRYTLFIFE